MVDPVDHAWDMAAQLEEEGPEDLQTRPVVDEYGQEREDQSQEDEEHFDHGASPQLCVLLGLLGLLDFFGFST